MKPLNGYRATHKNKWLLVKHGILSVQEVSLLEFYADIFDFDKNHSKFGTFEVDFTEIASVFNKSENTIRNWHNKLLTIGLIEKTSKLYIYKLKTPTRYITPGSWKGEAAIYAKNEKDKSIEFILSNIGINLQSIGGKVQPVVKKEAEKASKLHVIAIGSSKDRFKNRVLEVERSNELKRSEQEYRQILREGNFSSLGVDDLRWIDENQAVEVSEEELEPTLNKVDETSEKPSTNDLDLIKEEIKLRDSLSTYSKSSREYEINYHKWFAIREKGLSKGFYHFFIPSRYEPWMQTANKEAQSWN